MRHEAPGKHVGGDPGHQQAEQAEDGNERQQELREALQAIPDAPPGAEGDGAQEQMVEPVLAEPNANEDVGRAQALELVDIGRDAGEEVLFEADAGLILGGQDHDEEGGTDPGEEAPAAIEVPGHEHVEEHQQQDWRDRGRVVEEPGEGRDARDRPLAHSGETGGEDDHRQREGAGRGLVFDGENGGPDDGGPEGEQTGDEGGCAIAEPGALREQEDAEQAEQAREDLLGDEDGLEVDAGELAEADGDFIVGGEGEVGMGGDEVVREDAGIDQPLHHGQVDLGVLMEVGVAGENEEAEQPDGDQRQKRRKRTLVHCAGVFSNCC